MDRNELQQRYSKGRKNFANLNLSGLDLSYLQMPCADLSNSNLSGTKLTSANLEVANLSGANLESADLKWIKLVRANLSQANLRGVNMSNLNLGTANLEEANLEGASLFNTRLGGTNLTGANLTNTDLRRAWLNKVILRNADLTGADLTGANLQGSDLTGANLTNAKFDGVCWLEVQIDLSLLSEKDALIWRISNQGVDDLHGIDLSNTDLRSVNLQNIDLSDTNLRKANLLFANLSGANLSGANLSGANLAQANFTNANLTDVNLTNTQLYKTNFSSANFQNIQFNGSSFFNTNLVDTINVPPSILSTSLIPLNHPDTDLLNEIRSVTEELTCGSEKNDPYEIFIWNAIGKGEFTLEKLLRTMAYLIPTSIDNLQSASPDTDKLTTACQFLLSAIEGQLIGVELWQLETESIADVSSAKPCIVIGQTLDGDWLGITTQVMSVLEIEIKTDENFYINDSVAVKLENQKLISILDRVLPEANELLPDSEATEKITWSLTENRDAMLQNLLLSTKHFGIKDIKGGEYLFQRTDVEDDELDRRESFAQLVINNLDDVRVYFIGGCNVDIFLLGKTKNQDWIGIRTGVTWT
jgi:uncharacterized protein YjbI with pentapeptide repeats